MGGILSCCIGSGKKQQPEKQLLEMVVIRKPSGGSTGSNGNSGSIFGCYDANNFGVVHQENAFNEIHPAQASTSQGFVIQDNANNFGAIRRWDAFGEIQPAAQASTSQPVINQGLTSETEQNNEEEALMRSHSAKLRNESEDQNSNGNPPHICI